MIIKQKGFILTVEEDYVECEVYFQGEWYYTLEDNIFEELSWLIDDYINGNLDTKEFCKEFFLGVEFDGGKEFSNQEWEMIL